MNSSFNLQTRKLKCERRNGAHHLHARRQCSEFSFSLSILISFYRRFSSSSSAHSAKPDDSVRAKWWTVSIVRHMMRFHSAVARTHNASRSLDMDLMVAVRAQVDALNAFFSLTLSLRSSRLKNNNICCHFVMMRLLSEMCEQIAFFVEKRDKHTHHWTSSKERCKCEAASAVIVDVVAFASRTIVKFDFDSILLLCFIIISSKRSLIEWAGERIFFFISFHFVSSTIHVHRNWVCFSFSFLVCQVNA